MRDAIFTRETHHAGTSEARCTQCSYSIVPISLDRLKNTPNMLDMYREKIIDSQPLFDRRILTNTIPSVRLINGYIAGYSCKLRCFQREISEALRMPGKYLLRWSRIGSLYSLIDGEDFHEKNSVLIHRWRDLKGWLSGPRTHS